MGGVVFVISAHYAEHWDRAIAAGFWETVRPVPVEKGDLLVFWLAKTKRFLGVAQAVDPVEATDYSIAPRPWLVSDPASYQHRYRFDLLDNTGDDAITWRSLMTMVGQKPNRGANTAPVRFDHSGALALLNHLSIKGDQGQPAASDQPAAIVAPGTPIVKPFVKRVDYAAPALVSVSVRDPDAWGAGLDVHRKTENALAAIVEQRQLEPQDPVVGGPNFDLAWFVGDTLVVCEVKSITAGNELSQIRLGLGQVLDYAFALTTAGYLVEPWLVVDHEPESSHWTALCEANGVKLCWPEMLDGQLAVPST